VKPFENYKAITIALGIMVAVVVALTLWMTRDTEIVNAGSRTPVGINAENFIRTAVNIFGD
jgi:PDZ domain-containing secreted protein